jgi:hypothetical protein
MKRVDAVQGDAQALVQTSAPGVNTGGLESDLEIMVDKWSELNEKVQLVFYLDRILQLIHFFLLQNSIRIYCQISASVT